LRRGRVVLAPALAWLDLVSVDSWKRVQRISIE
jgi:hypothetical protein